ncbi:MAG: HAD family phosphatase [Lachnospiraceae bacterium]|nr:HAD family phosphatase [Lachnospiraceae bacterium]MBR2276069.1 HAD family phosphatase [Lachnospiraceae bacterium]
MAIKNIVFDIGNVLLAFCWQKHLTKLGFEGEIFDRVAHATVLDPLWNEMDRGVMTNEEIIRGYIRNDPGVETEILKMMEDLGGLVEPFSGTKEWLRSLQKNGYKVYALSNFSEKCYTEAGPKMDFLELMDGYILSYREKLIKPDPAIYKLLCDRYSLLPSECVFMDDTQANVDAAIRFGMHAFVYKSRDLAVKELLRLGVNS